MASPLNIRFVEFPEDFSRSTYVHFISVTFFEKECPVVILLMRMLCSNGRLEIHRTRLRLADNALLEGAVGHPQNLKTLKRMLPAIRRFIDENQTAQV